MATPLENTPAAPTQAAQPKAAKKGKRPNLRSNIMPGKGDCQFRHALQPEKGLYCTQRGIGEARYCQYHSK